MKTPFKIYKMNKKPLKKELPVKRKNKFLAGFTMIEIMLVVIIIGVLAAMVVPNLAGRGKQARVATAQVDIEAHLTTALDLYELDNGFYPTTQQGLEALLKAPVTAPEPNNWSGPYLKKRALPLDPWRRPYMYVSPGVNNPESFDLFSLGPDGIQNDDDIINWVIDKLTFH